MKSFKMHFLSLFIASAIALQVSSAYCMNNFNSVNAANYPTATHSLFNSRRFLGGLLLGLSVLATMIFIIDRFIIHRNNPQGGGGNGDGNKNPIKPSGINDFKNKTTKNKKNPVLTQKQAREKARKKREEKNKQERERKEQEFRDFGISEWQIPYVKDAKKDGDVLKIQWKTVSQFSNNVIRGVTEKQEQLTKEQEKKINQVNTKNLDRKAKSDEIKIINNDYDRKIIDYKPNATCPSQAIRNAGLMMEFFRSQGNQNQQQQILENIKSVEHARNYLNQLIQKDKATSWLEPKEIVKRMLGLSEDEFFSSLDNGSIQRGAYGFNLLDAGVLQLATSLHEVKDKFREEENHPYAFHVFMIETGEVIHSGEFDQACNRLSDNEKMPLQLADINTLRRYEENKSHYYVVAMERIGNQVRYYTLDTMSNNHIREADFSFRDDYLCDIILNGQSNIDVRDCLKKYSEKVVDNYIKMQQILKKAKEEKKKVKREIQKKLDDNDNKKQQDTLKIELEKKKDDKEEKKTINTKLYQTYPL